jgi:hypothetical protein
MRNAITILVLALALVVSACGGSPYEPTTEAAPTSAQVGSADDQVEDATVPDEERSEPSDEFAGFSEAQTEYLDETAEIADGYAVWFGELTDQIDLVIADSALFDDETWKADSEEILANISRLNQEVRDLESPEGFDKIHGHFVEAAEHYESFVSLYAEGIDELDVGKIDRAIDAMVAGSDVMGNASDSIDELLE